MKIEVDFEAGYIPLEEDHGHVDPAFILEIPDELGARFVAAHNALYAVIAEIDTINPLGYFERARSVGDSL